MTFTPFAVERWLSETEHGVRYNLSESGVHPMRYGDLVEAAGIDLPALMDARADYPQVEGTARLRERIAAMHGADPVRVLVTHGASEANCIVAEAMLRPGDAMVRLVPTYAQLPGHARNLGHEVRAVALGEGWRLDPGRLQAAMDDRVRLIHVVNPNNPTGRVLDAAERAAILDAAERHGAWIVADEVYRGTERRGAGETPSFWGAHPRVIVIDSMSKAYGLPGLRLGWVLAPPEVIGALWRRHEYHVIAAADLSMRLAEAALAPGAREALRDRARRLIRRGWDTLSEVLATRPETFSVTEPDASAMSFVRVDAGPSEALARRLLARQDLLLVPGIHFGVEGHLRLSSALPEDHLREALRRLVLETDAVRAEIRPLRPPKARTIPSPPAIGV